MVHAKQSARNTAALGGLQHTDASADCRTGCHSAVLLLLCWQAGALDLPAAALVSSLDIWVGSKEAGDAAAKPTRAPAWIQGWVSMC